MGFYECALWFNRLKTNIKVAGQVQIQRVISKYKLYLEICLRMKSLKMKKKNDFKMS